MLVRGQTTEERIGEIANKFNQGLQGYAQTQRQEVDDLRTEAALRQRAIEAEQAKTLKSFEVASKFSSDTGRIVDPGKIKSLMDTGNLSGIGELLNNSPVSPKFENDQLKIKNQRDKEEFERSEREKPVEETRAYQIALARSASAAEAKVAAEERNAKRKSDEALKKAAIPDFDVADPAVIPSSKDSEEVKKLNASNKSFQEIGKRVVQNVARSTPRDPRYFLSNEWKILNQDLTKMKLQAKNLEDLGVLNGPDLGLVNDTFGSIEPSALALLGPEAAAKRLQTAVDTANMVMMNAASARGYKPKGGDSISSKQSAPANGPAIGTVDAGYVFIGGNPADPSSWQKAK